MTLPAYLMICFITNYNTVNSSKIEISKQLSNTVHKHFSYFWQVYNIILNLRLSKINSCYGIISLDLPIVKKSLHCEMLVRVWNHFCCLFITTTCTVVYVYRATSWACVLFTLHAEFLVSMSMIHTFWKVKALNTTLRS